MAKQLTVEGQLFEIGSVGEGVRFTDDGSIREFLGRALDEPANAQVLRDALGAAAVDLDDQDLLLEAGSRVARGEIRIVRKRGEGVAPVAFEGEAEKASVAEKQEKVWVAIQVVDDATGGPVKGIKLKLTVAGGDEREEETDKKGIAEFEGIPEGTYGVTSPIQGAIWSGTYVYLGLGERPMDAEVVEGAPLSGASTLACVETAELKEGERLEDSAAAHGTTWEALALFNWGTTDRAKVESFLSPGDRETVSPAEPASGMLPNQAPPPRPRIYIPRPIPPLSVTTLHTHVVRVRRFFGENAFVSLVLYDDDWAAPLPDVPYEIEGPDGVRFEGTTDGEGALEHGPVPQGYYRLTVSHVLLRQGLEEEEKEEVTAIPSESEDEELELLESQEDDSEWVPPKEKATTEEAEVPVPVPQGSVTLAIPTVLENERRCPQRLPLVLPYAAWKSRWKGDGAGNMPRREGSCRDGRE